MNRLQVERLRDLLIEACDHHIEVDGGKIISGMFFLDDASCPLDCLFGRISVREMAQEASQMLNTTISYDDLWAFMDAFDGSIYVRNNHFVSAILLGKELRHKYIGG